MPIRCIIVEDEPLAAERLKNYIRQLPQLDLVGSFDGAMEARQFISSQPVDLIFLDINMDGLSGIQLLESIHFEGKVVITTAYHEYALKGYDLNVTDYLLKPFTIERFLKAVDKVTALSKAQPLQPSPEFIFVKTEYRLEKVFLHEILFIEGMRDYRRIHTTSRRIMTLQNFKQFEKDIPSHLICRVHKSFMVAIAKIDAIERERIRIKDHFIPISETYKKELMGIIGTQDKK